MISVDITKEGLKVGVVISVERVYNKGGFEGRGSDIS